jgi:parallel beta-helix repeat protein
MTAAAQAAIDALPTGGGEVVVPNETLLVTSVNLAGSDNDKSNVTLRGEGLSSWIKQAGTARASNVPGGDTTQSPNVLYAYYGSGFRVASLRLSGNKDTGGVKPTQAAAWAGNTVYTYDAGSPTYRQTQEGGTAIVSEAATDKVWRLLVSHTSDATDIDVDVALGRWEQVTNFAALNGYYYDESFNRGMCVYFGGPNGGSEVTDVTIESCRIEGAYYANVLCGSGPEKTGLVGAGCRNGRVIGCSIDNSSAGIGGLLRHDFEITGNTITGVTGNGINCDRDGSNQVISANTIIGHATEAGRNGISSYRSDHIVVTGNYIANFGNAGINFQDQSNAADLAGIISSNTIVDCGQVATDSGQGNTGIVVGSSDHVPITGNHIRNPHFNGIKVSDSNGVSVVGNTVYEAGAFGINFEDCVGFTCTGNTARLSGRDNFYFEGARLGTISGNVGIDGNTDDSATLYSGFRIGPFGATESNNITVVGNFASDTRTPKQQHYGLNIESASVGITVLGNDFTTNLTGDILSNGTNCQIGFNNQGGTGSWRTRSSITPYSDLGQTLGASTLRWANIFGNKLTVAEGISLPSAITGHSQLFYHTAGAELSMMLASGIVKRLSGHESDTAANIASVAATINTANKYANKLAWDATNNRMLRASGSAAADPWHVVDGSATVTPA